MAISLTRGESAILAFFKAAPTASEVESKLLIPHIEAAIDTAVQAMTDAVAMSPKYYYLQNEFNLTLASDSNTGLGAIALDPTVMADTVKGSRGGQVWAPAYILPLSWLPTLEDLYLYHPGGTELGYYTVKGGNFGGGIVYAADYQGAAITGSIKVIACAYPTFASLPAMLEDEFINALVNVARNKITALLRAPSND